MSNLTDRIPKYRKHCATGQAVVTLKGHDVYLGVHGTKASRIEYDRHILEWLAAGRQLAFVDANFDLTVSEILARYWQFAKQHYRKEGRATPEVNNLRYALRPVKELYGPHFIYRFSPSTGFSGRILNPARGMVRLIESPLRRALVFLPIQTEQVFGKMNRKASI